MKIFVCFNIERLKGVKLESDDVVLFHSDEKNINKNFININNFNLDFSIYKNNFDCEINELIENSGLNVDAKRLINSIRPNIYLHNLRFCIYWVQSFKSVLTEKCEEIVFTDYVNIFGYFPFYEAEGEINRKFLYENHDFISFQLMRQAKKFIARNKNCKISVINNHSLNKLKIKIFIRRYFLFLAKIIFHFFKICTTKRLIKVNAEKSIIISSRSIAHSMGLENLFNNHCIIHSCDGLTFSNNNFNFISKRHDHSYSQYQTLSLLDLFYSIKKCIFIYKDKNILNSIEILGVKVFLKSIFIEGVIMHLESELFARSIFNLSKKNNKTAVIIIPELISPYTLWVKEFLKNSKIKLIQLQTVSIDIVPSPNFIFADLFLFDSKNNLNFFKKYFSDKLNKMDYWGNINIKKNSFIERKSLKNIIYFTQPYEYDVQNKILFFLLNYSRNNNLKLFIKPHPRENLEKIPNKIFNELNILSKEITEKEYSAFCDLAILRTSSLSQDLIIKGIPTVNFLNSSFDKSVKLNFLKKNEINICYEFYELETILDKFSIFTAGFYKFRSNFMIDQGLNLGLEDFKNNLNKYMKNN